MLNLVELEERLDSALAIETAESLSRWLRTKRLTALVKYKFDMEKKTSLNHKTANVGNMLLVAVFLIILIGGAYKFGKELNKDIKYKKEMIETEKEKLRLEIELKRLQIESSQNGT